MALTYKQILFVEAYLGTASGNASEAARIAGYAHPGQLGHQLLKKTSIQARIDARLSMAAMPANEVLARLSEFAMGNLGDFLNIDEGGNWKVDLRKAKRACKLKLLKKVKATKEGTEIELHSPLDALDKLARHHGLYADKDQSPEVKVVVERRDRSQREDGETPSDPGTGEQAGEAV